MKIKFFGILILFISLFTCKNTQENATKNLANNIDSQEITEEDIAKLKFVDFVLDSKTEKAIENWQEYIQLQDIVTNVKKGDLSFLNDNNEVIVTLLNDLKKNIPETVNTSSILARIVALETKLYKLESLANLNTTTTQELKGVIKEFLVSFSNLNLQMNKKLEKDGQHIVKP